jgi:hypothetical protein
VEKYGKFMCLSKGVIIWQTLEHKSLFCLLLCYSLLSRWSLANLHHHNNNDDGINKIWWDHQIYNIK